jgi:DNA-directed RNA polymerase subunit M/transcription elongation factor TFIIS
MDSWLIANPQNDLPCPECGSMMWLDRIEPRELGYEERTFECPRCLYSDSALVEVSSSTQSR